MARKKSTARPSDLYPGCYELYSAGENPVAIIDAADVEAIVRYRWRRNDQYTIRTFTLLDGRQTSELLQRAIGANAGWDIAESNVTFINKDSRDCRRENLLVVKRPARKRTFLVVTDAAD